MASARFAQLTARPPTPNQHPGSLSSGSLLSSRLFSRSSWNMEQVLWCHNCSHRVTSCYESWSQRLIQSIQIGVIAKASCLSISASFVYSKSSQIYSQTGKPIQFLAHKSPNEKLEHILMKPRLSVIYTKNARPLKTHTEKLNTFKQLRHRQLEDNTSAA